MLSRALGSLQRGLRVMPPLKTPKKPSNQPREARSLWNNPVGRWKSPFGRAKSILDTSVKPADVEKAMRTGDEQSKPFATPVTAEALDQSIP